MSKEKHIGEPGVGKTAIVEGLAQRVMRGDVPEWMQDQTIFALDMGALVAGDMPEGSRVEVVLDEGQLAVRHQPLEAGTET